MCWMPEPRERNGDCVFLCCGQNFQRSIHWGISDDRPMDAIAIMVKAVMPTDLEFGRIRLEMIFPKLWDCKLGFSEIREGDEVVGEVASVTSLFEIARAEGGWRTGKGRARHGWS